MAVTAGHCRASAPASGRLRIRGDAQPNRRVMRLKAVIAKRMLHPDRRLALDLLLRCAAAALSAGLILGLLPAITQAAA